MSAALSLRAALAQSLVAGFDGLEANDDLAALFGRHGLGGAIWFGRNVKGPRQVWGLNAGLQKAAADASRPPLFVMVDQEGGSVARLKEPFLSVPDMRDLGAEPDPAGIKGLAAGMARELLAAGFNWDLAPVMDVHAMAGGVMERRSLGPDPELVSSLGSAFIQGMQGQGVLACAKHFPGLGRTTLDTHRERPQVDLPLDELRRLELPPFAAAIRAKVAGVMVCHAVFKAIDPQRPASLSPLVIQGLLRGELGYGGLVLSDDLEMGALAAGMEPDQAAVRAYEAGCDLLLVCQRPEFALKALDQLERLVKEGRIEEKLVQERAQRILAVKKGLSYQPASYASLEKIISAKA